MLTAHESGSFTFQVLSSVATGLVVCISFIDCP